MSSDLSAAVLSPTGAGTELSTVPLNDLKRQTMAIRRELDEAIAQAVDRGWYVFGPSVAKFEEQFARYCGARHCLGVANGTDALELAFRSIEIRPGDEVLTVANAGMYAASAIAAIGAKPVFVDVDPASMLMSPQMLTRSIGPRTAAIVVTHLYGALADMPALMATAREHQIPVIEDCAQAHGAEHAGRKAGTFGAIGCYSFYPTKNLGALGDGGALVTNDDALAERLRALRQYGWTRKYEAGHAGGRNSRLDELQAALLSVKLPHLDGWNARRRDIIENYRRAAAPGIVVPDTSGKDHAAHLCVVRSPRRNALREFLSARKIATDIHYPIPDHRQPAMRAFIGGQADLKETETLADEILTIPCFPEMTGDEIARVCDALSAFGKGAGQP